MPTDFISLFTACLIAACAPIIARIIPRGLVPETVILLLAGALLGPHMAGLIELTDSMNMISELGLAFLFLLAGYEIDRKARRALPPGPFPWCLRVRRCTSPLASP